MTDIQVDRQTTDIQVDRQTTDIKRVSQPDHPNGRQTERQTDRERDTEQTDRKNRQTE